MSKHTPGPWRVEVGDDPDKWADFFPVVLADEGEVVGVEGIYSGNRDVDIANAYLIAASPELLEVLEEFVNVYGVDDVHRWMQVRDKARAAIAKATLGETP